MTTIVIPLEGAADFTKKIIQGGSISDALALDILETMGMVVVRNHPGKKEAEITMPDSMASKIIALHTGHEWARFVSQAEQEANALTSKEGRSLLIGDDDE